MSKEPTPPTGPGPTPPPSPLNEEPTDIELSESEVDENIEDGFVVGTLTTIDPDQGDSHRLELIDDAGGAFVIEGNQLVVADGQAIDFEEQEEYAIEVRTTDSGGETLTKSFAISVNDLNDPPEINVPSARQTINEGNSSTIGGISVSDDNAGNRKLEISLIASNSKTTGGTLSLGSTDTDGLNFLQGDGENDREIVFRATLDDINEVLDNLVYNADDAGDDVINITLDDRDNNSPGKAQTSTESINVFINDLPRVVKNNELAVANQTLTQEIDTSLLRTNDSDNGEETFTYTVTSGPGEGKLLVNGKAATSFTQEDIDEGDVEYKFTGNSNVTEDSFKFRVADADGGKTGQQTFDIRINQPPEVESSQLNVIVGTEDNIGSANLDATDPDVNNAPDSSLVYELTEQPTSGKLQLNDTNLAVGETFTQQDINQGNVSYVHTGSDTGSDLFSYSVSDRDGGVTTGQLDINITPPNEEPVAGDDIFETDSVTQLTITDEELLANDSDADEGDTISIVDFSTEDTEGTVERDGEEFTYTPPSEDFTGQDSFTYTIQDTKGVTDTATVFVSVEEVPNEAPAAEDDSFETEEGTQLTIATSELLENDSDPDEGDEISIASFSAEDATGTVSQKGNNFIYTPPDNFSGEDTFTYTVEDERGETDTATVTVEVLGIATPPTLEVTDSVSGTEDEDIALDIQASLTGDDESETLSITIADVPDTATFSAGTNNGDGTWTLTAAQLENLTLSSPQDGQDGTSSFTLTVTATVTDSQSDDTASESATIGVAVDALNDAPVLSEDTFQLNTINENVTNSNGTLVSNLIADSVTDADADAVQGIAVTRVASGNGTWQYSTDGGDTWVDFDSVSNDSATVLTATNSDRIRFVPNTDFVGDATIRFRAWDTTTGESSGTTGVDASTNGGTTAFSSDVGVATITVNDVPEVTTNSELVVNEGEEGTVAQSLLQTTDSDNGEETFSYSVLTDPSSGQLLLNGEAASNFTQEDIDSGSVTYEHTANNTNDDSFVFRVFDADGAATKATFNIRVNDPPEGTTSDFTVLIGATGEIGSSNLSYSDPDVSDAAASSLSYTLTELPAGGNLLLNGETLAVGNEFTQANVNNGALAYENTAEEEGTESFSFTASDGDGGTTTGSLNIEVLQGNRAPAVEDDKTITLDEDTTANLDIPAPTDADGDALSITVDTIPDAEKGQVQLASGSAVAAGVELTEAQLTGLQFVPAANENGAAGDFSYSVSDGNDENNSATQTITLDITPVNDPPVAVDDGPVFVTSGSDIPVDVLANDSDVDEGDELTIVDTTEVPTRGRIGDDSSLIINYEVFTGAFGTEVLDYTISDGASEATAIATIEVLVVSEDADSLTGGDFNDVFEGAGGNDTLAGAAGNDSLLGNDDNDSLDGGAGNDSISGGDGNDTIVGGLGADSTSGGNGDDVFVYNSLDSDRTLFNAADTTSIGTAVDAGIYDRIVGFSGLGSEGGDTIQLSSGIVSTLDSISTSVQTTDLSENVLVAGQPGLFVFESDGSSYLIYDANGDSTSGDDSQIIAQLESVSGIEALNSDDFTII
ncbi:MAG: cadherin-like domain-containing protein [Cyanobacteriota bacterium]|nr:cadherin-like domain-containing protein [Cyanobacteriota bacterium]